MIATVYGDAILPRGGSLALADLLILMSRLGATEGVVRTAVSRLAKDGILKGRRYGRRSAYALTSDGQIEFEHAAIKIYGPANPPWDGHLHLAFPTPGTDRSALESAGFMLVAPGMLLSPYSLKGEDHLLSATGSPGTMRDLAARTWPLARLSSLYSSFIETFTPLLHLSNVSALDGMAGRTAVIHAWRRIALRDPHLPLALLTENWPGTRARALCIELYEMFASWSETWLDSASSGQAALPPGPNPVDRFKQQPADNQTGFL